MKKLSSDIINFFQNQGCVIVSTVDKSGHVHCSCKGIVKIEVQGRIYLLDLYVSRTRENLKDNPHMSITAIDEHRFAGYSLKGKARIVSDEKLKSQLASAWEARITSRLTQRLLRNIREEKGHPRHPEVMMPKPQYLIVMEVEEAVDMTPRHLK
mgnify:CR=1 FL=1